MDKNLEYIFSSEKQDWTTPKWLFNELDVQYNFTLDPCSNGVNAKCKKFYTKKENGLEQDWSNERVFMNPPYGKAISKWVIKAYKESLKGALVVCLIPSRTDTSYWHDYIFPYASEINYIRGRIKFGGATSTAPFPSAIVVFGEK